MNGNAYYTLTMEQVIDDNIDGTPIFEHGYVCCEEIANESEV